MAGASSALARIEAVLPTALAQRQDSIMFFAPGFKMPTQHRRLLDRLHAACLSCHAIEFAYKRLDGEASDCSVRPLALYFWGGVWTLVAWCELRGDFRSFRVDRISDAQVLERTFEQMRGQRLTDYLRAVRRKIEEWKQQNPMEEEADTDSLRE